MIAPSAPGPPIIRSPQTHTRRSSTREKAKRMICCYNDKIATYDIILASSSPRRQSILRENIGLSFRIEVPNFKEDIDKSVCTDEEDYVSRTSKAKCLEIIQRVQRDGASPPATLIISADTIISFCGTVLEKPADPQSACTMLKLLSGKEHQVLTAVTIALLSPSPTQNEAYVKTFCESTRVRFSDLSDETIAAYVATGEPLDKAGSYGIQGIGSSLVKGIDGCYFNVVGFPIHRFCKELIEMLKTVEAV